MTGPLDSITGVLVGKALDNSLAIHQVIAHNVANANSTGFRPLAVDFEVLLGDLKTAFEGSQNAETLRQRVAHLDLPVATAGDFQTVQLDQQIVALAKNTTHYQALLGARNLYGDIINLAIRGGKG